MRPRRSHAATAGARRSRPRSASRVASGASCSSRRSGPSRFPPAPRSVSPRSPTWSPRRSRTRRRTTRFDGSARSRLLSAGSQPSSPPAPHPSRSSRPSSRRPRRLLGLERIELVRYDGDNTGTVIAASGEHPFPARSTWSLDDPSVMATVARRRARRASTTTAPCRARSPDARSAGFHSAIGAPLTVEGSLWGMIIAISTDPDRSPNGPKLVSASSPTLVATAVANAEARQALERVAAEQATLRRIATLVARGVQPEEVFAAVAEETSATFGALTALMRFEHDPPGVVLVGASKETRLADRDCAGSSPRAWPRPRSTAPDGPPVSARTRSTGRRAVGRWAEMGARLGIVSRVSCPILVEGVVWGAIAVNGREELPPDTEQRLEKFTGLVSTAIANAEGKSELAASRRRIVAAADEARRRIERDLHDGIQQRLIALGYRAREMMSRPPEELPGIAAELSEGLNDVSDELQEVSRGIHPTILTRAGLGPALRALARRSNVPTEVDVSLDGRLPAPVEAAAYYIASEALTNVEKHAEASLVELTVTDDDGTLRLEVRDDGIGGADTGRGSGILGLTDRVEALGGPVRAGEPAGAWNHDLGRASDRHAGHAVTACGPGEPAGAHPHGRQCSSRTSVADTSRRSSRALREAVYDHGLRLVLLPTQHEHAREVSLLDRLMQGATDGAVVVLPEETTEELEQALSDQLPVRRGRSAAAARRSHPDGVGRAQVRRRAGDAAPADARPPSNRGDHRTAGMAGDGGSPRGVPRLARRRGHPAGPGARGRLRLPGRTGRRRQRPRCSTSPSRRRRSSRSTTRSRSARCAPRAIAGCASRRISPSSGSTTSSPRCSSRRRSRRFVNRSARWDARRSTSSSASSSGERARPRTSSSRRGSSCADRPRLRDALLIPRSGASSSRSAARCSNSSWVTYTTTPGDARAPRAPSAGARWSRPAARSASRRSRRRARPRAGPARASRPRPGSRAAGFGRTAARPGRGRART